MKRSINNNVQQNDTPRQVSRKINFTPDEELLQLHFEKMNQDNEEWITRYLQEKDKTSECEWIAYFLENVDTFYLHDNRHVYGAIMFQRTEATI